MSKSVMVTGGCGFVGHHIVEHLLKNTDWRIVVVDKLTYASSGFDRLRDIEAFDDSRVTVLTADIGSEMCVGVCKEAGDVNYVLHLAAESHVDNSIENPEPFVRSNVLGTMHLLNYARHLDSLERFVYFSTDEVFGPAPPGIQYKEWDRYKSSNPYAATKAGGEELAIAYANTYKLPIIVTHCMNIFGERQHPEKFIPMVIKKVLTGDTVTIHADPTCTRAGTRYYIHARNVADAIMFLLSNSSPGEKYNIVGENEVSNLDMANTIAGLLGKSLHYEMVNFHESRPGHDLRYALDGSKMQSMGWTLPKSFEDSLAKAVQWYVDNPRWLEL